MARTGDDTDPYLAAFLSSGTVDSLSRGLLVELVSGICVHEDKSIEIEFTFADPRSRAREDGGPEG